MCNCPSCAFLPLDKSHTRAQVPHSALLMPLVSMESFPLLPNSSQILDSDPYHGLGLYILYTRHLHAPLIMVPYPTSNSASPSTGSTVACGFVGLPISDPVSVLHANSPPFPMLFPRLKDSAMTMLFSGVMSKMP